MAGDLVERCLCGKDFSSRILNSIESWRIGSQFVPIGEVEDGGQEGIQFSGDLRLKTPQRIRFGADGFKPYLGFARW